MRAHLQAGTRTQHDRLDRQVSGLDLLCVDHFRSFLTGQLLAREAIEEWADQHCPALLRPPSTSWLLREDLAILAQSAPGRDEPVPPSPGPFVLPADCDPLGLAWAIAGSHLGNRAMLAQMRKRAGDQPAPALASGFLADPRMTAFWHRLLPRLQDEVSEAAAAPALEAARAVFARFEQAFAPESMRCRQAA